MDKKILKEIKSTKIVVVTLLDNFLNFYGHFQKMWENDYSEKTLAAKNSFEAILEEFKNSINMLEMADVNSSDDFINTIEQELEKSGKIIEEQTKIFEANMDFLM